MLPGNTVAYSEHNLETMKTRCRPVKPAGDRYCCDTGYQQQ